MFKIIKIVLLNLFLLSLAYAKGESSLSYNLNAITEKLKIVSEYVGDKKNQQEKVTGFQVRFGNLVTKFATSGIGHNELTNTRKELEEIEKNILLIDTVIEQNQELLKDLRGALNIKLNSIQQLKKSGNRAEKRNLVKRKKEIKKIISKIDKLEKALGKRKEVTSDFLKDIEKWKASLSHRAQKGIDQQIEKVEMAVLFTNPSKIGHLLKKDVQKIIQSNRTKDISLFISENRVKIFLRVFLSIVLMVFFVKIGKVLKDKVPEETLSSNSSNLMNDVFALLLSQKILLVLSSTYLLTQQNLGVLSYSSFPTLIDFICTSLLSLMFWHYFYIFIVLPRIKEVVGEGKKTFSFPKSPLYFYIILRVFGSSFAIENLLVDIISNLLLVYISYKFFWLSVYFKISEKEQEQHYYTIFAKSSKFLVMFFSSILFISCFLNLFGSFSLGGTIQSVVFSNLLIFIVAWFIYQLLLINLDQFISKVDKGNLQFRKRIVDVLIFIRNYSNILLFTGFSYFVLNSWFNKLFVFSSFSKISIFKMGDYAFTVDRPFYVIWAIFCVRVIHLILLWAVDSYFLKRFKISRRHSANIYSITRYIFFVVYFLVISAVLGVTYKNLLIFASALGVGIGFGLQNIVNNFLSGIILLFEQPIRVGDLIDVEGQLCHVKHLGIRSTIVQTMDNSSVIIPNSELLSNKVTNWTLNDNDVGLKCEVGVAYGTDSSKVSEILMGIGVANKQVLQFPSPQVWFNEFGDSSLNFVLKVWIDEPANKYLIKTELMHEINRLLAENKIVIPFPQRDVHIVRD